MKQKTIDVIWRIAALVLALAVTTSGLSLSRAKYISDPTNYQSGTDDYFFTYRGRVESTTPTTGGNPIFIKLKKGWWAFSLRGGQGGKNLRSGGDNVRNSGNGGSSGVAVAMYYFNADTTVYYYVAEGGGYAGNNGSSSPFTGGNNPIKNSVYGGGKRGTGSSDSRQQPSNGGGATLLYYGHADPKNTAATIIAVAGGGGGGGYDSGNADADYIITDFSGGWAGSAVATVATGTPAKVTQILDNSANDWRGRPGGNNPRPGNPATKRGTNSYEESGGGGSLETYGSGGQNNTPNGDGDNLQGGNGGCTSNAKGGGGGGGGYYGGGGGGGRGSDPSNARYFGAGGGGSSFLHADCYQLPTAGAYRHAYEYFNSNGYNLISGENNAGQTGSNGTGTNANKPARHDGAICLMYLGVESIPRCEATGY